MLTAEFTKNFPRVKLPSSRPIAIQKLKATFLVKYTCGGPRPARLKENLLTVAQTSVRSCN